MFYKYLRDRVDDQRIQRRCNVRLNQMRLCSGVRIVVKIIPGRIGESVSRLIRLGFTLGYETTKRGYVDLLQVVGHVFDRRHNSVRVRMVTRWTGEIERRWSSLKEKSFLRSY